MSYIGAGNTKLPRRLYNNHYNYDISEIREYNMTQDEYNSLSDDEHYSACIELASLNNELVIPKLFDIYINANNRHNQKNARKGLRLMDNRDNVMVELENRIGTAESLEDKFEYLRAAIRFDTDYIAQFLEVMGELYSGSLSYDLIMEIASLPNKSAKDYRSIVGYMLEKNNFNKVMVSILPEVYKRKLCYGIINKIQDNELEITNHILYILYRSNIGLGSIKNEIYEYIANNEFSEHFEYIIESIEERLDQ